MAIQFVNDFGKKNKTKFVIRHSSTKPGNKLVYVCKHGMKRRSESTGIRPIQSTVKRNCPAFIRFYHRASGEVILNDFQIDHQNHEISENIYMQDNAKVTPEALKIIMQLLSSNCKVANIKSALLAKGITPDLTSLKREKKRPLKNYHS